MQGLSNVTMHTTMSKECGIEVTRDDVNDLTLMYVNVRQGNKFYFGKIEATLKQESIYYTLFD